MNSERHTRRQVIDLNTLIPPGADLQLTYAVAINDKGEIAGFGVPPGCAPQDYELCGHAYVLLPCDDDSGECINVTSGARNPNSAAAPVPHGISANPATNPAASPQRLDNIFGNENHFPGRSTPH